MSITNNEIFNIHILDRRRRRHFINTIQNTIILLFSLRHVIINVHSRGLTNIRINIICTWWHVIVFGIFVSLDI